MIIRVRLLALVFSLFLCASWTSAAVSIHLNNDQSEIVGPWVGGIIDGADPVGNLQWRPFEITAPSQFVLNPQGEANGDHGPSTLRNPVSDLAVVVWAKNMGTQFDIVMSYFDTTSNAWTLPLVLAGSTDDELDPYLFSDPADGSVHLVYWVNDGLPHVVHRQAPADLSSWSSPATVSQPGEIAARPAGVFHLGQMKVAYEAHTFASGGTPRQVIVATQQGASFVSEVLATTGHQQPNNPRIHSGLGRLWVDWVDDAGAMTWRKQTGPGGWEPILSEPFTDTEDLRYHVRGRIRGLVIQD